ncbi:hypothetical protein F0L74_20935 [Chitinophaga agrisoli]|uniref:Uncharacterized protein n=1 Tax=Chitinophaga agrisoli TaxID=2607653 RepID=A0A5B2VKB2_9BACT|nr:hypothetical protein [Chitinophaga agrisoli]KAA2238687.1 hypothetical protein F0L74_20935 [Chitinophaga agrisoli]
MKIALHILVLCLCTAGTASAQYINNDTAQQNATFNINGIGRARVFRAMQTTIASGNVHFAIEQAPRLLRWGIGTSNVEDGTDLIGSDFTIYAYRNDANYLGQYFFIKRANGYVGIGTGVPEGRLHVNGHTYISGGSNLYMKGSGTLPTDPGDLIFLANDNTEYARIYTQVGGGQLRFSVGSAPTSSMVITSAGAVGIGTITPGTSNKLSVEGTIGARKVRVTAGPGWPDFVFHPGYKLPSLQELDTYIKANQHLPEIPTAAEVEKEGQDLGDMNKKLLQKVEELTLLLINESKRNDHLQQEVDLIKQQMAGSKTGSAFMAMPAASEQKDDK